MPLGRKHHSDNIKRASYYVCFIGAKESPVVRDHDYGREFVYPAMEYLLRTVVEAGPISSAPKITLQVSGKGLKIMQNVPRVGLLQSRLSSGKTDTLRHFVPHHCVTCAFQGPAPYDDLVATILLIYNPATRCPVHIHVYRCDSNNTAAFLTQQLVSMSQKAENQAKFEEIEAKLSGRGLLHPITPQNTRDLYPQSRRLLTDKMQHSDDQNSSRTSSSPGTSDSGVATTSKHDAIRSLSVTSSNGKSQEHTPLPTCPNANVTKLTAEFQQRLQTRDSAPMLLPPKDYDTVNRSRGKTGLDLINTRKNGAGSSGLKVVGRTVPVEPYVTDVSVQTSRRDGGPEGYFTRLKTASPVLKNNRLIHRSSDNILESKQTKDIQRVRAQSDDEDWQVEDDHDQSESFTNLNHDQPVFTKLSDFNKNLFQERMKRYSSLNDIFGDIKLSTLASDQVTPVKAPVMPVHSPSPAAAASSSSDASAAYRPRPYYFATQETEKDGENERESRNLEQQSNDTRWREQENASRDDQQRDQGNIIQSRNVRPNLPVKRNQRPVVNERARPASFYERIRFDDCDFQEGRFVRPEMVYYQYRS